MTEVIKNFLALIFSTAVWGSGLWGILALYYFVVERDVFYLLCLVLCLSIIGLGILVGKYNPRVRAALEVPMGILGL